MTEFTKEIQLALASPFPDDQVGWKPQVTTKGRDKQPIMRGDVQVAGCTAHIDARAVMNRLDEVVGVGSWSDAYTVLPNGKNVQCTLTVFGVSKSDVGEPNDGGFADNMKAAYSDALKRAAVKFGIGRYLYDMEMEWLPYDGYKVTGTPGATKTSSKPQAPKKPADSRGDMTPDEQAKRDPRKAAAPAFKVGDEVKSKKTGEIFKVTAVTPSGMFVVANADNEYTVDGDKLAAVE